MTYKSTLPRRICIDKNIPAELAIRNAVLEVEKVGADPLLTDAVTLLAQAREKVADYVDAHPDKDFKVADHYQTEIVSVEKYEDWQQRVVDEKSELDIKLNKLEAYLYKQSAKAGLSKKEQDDFMLLKEQYTRMNEYSSILDIRIRRFGISL